MGSSSKEPLLEKGTVLNGKWEIIEHIATGGMAEVYRARQIKLERQVAIKIMSEDFLKSFEGDEEEIKAALDRFNREVMVMAQVHHPYVLQVYDQDRAIVGRNGQELTIEYIAMEYVPGPNLRFTMPPEGLRDNERGIREWIRRYFLPILEGVETVHGLGIVHRDLKPENILLEGFTPKIMDFGIAGGPRWHGLTQDHHMFGTLQYIAPEQMMDLGETDVRGDIYSLGKILYEALTGKMVKETAFPLKTARLANPDTPLLKRLDRIIQQATSEDKAQRLPSAAVFREALLEALERTEGSAHPGRARPELWILVTALLVVAAVSIGLYVLYHREKVPLSTGPMSPSPHQATPSQVSGGATSEAPYTKKGGIIQGRDGAVLKLIPSGEVTFPADFGPRSGQTAKVKPFYMDETEVTNHQYVEFLNQNLSRVDVAEGVVRGDGRIWLLLGEVREGYEPVVFRDGRFHIKDPQFAANPVVRVTAYGSEAYANFFGRRLPTEAEWLGALEGGKGTAGSAAEEGTALGSMHEQMMRQLHGTGRQLGSKIPQPVGDSPPNAYGLKGLGGNVREWAQAAPPQRAGAPRYVVLPSGAPRQPWEAFEDAGFRCALSLGSMNP